MSTDLLLQMQNAAIDLARQLGAAERDVENLKRDNAALRARPMTVVPRETVPFMTEPVPRAEDRGEQWRMEQTAISVMSVSNTRESFIRQQLPADHEYRTPALGDVERAIAREITLIEKLRVDEGALHKLARLGNGDKLGNSEGNCMAQEALARINTIAFLVTS
jgi:hypothetical protein